jgi:ribonucrease Y
MSLTWAFLLIGFSGLLGIIIGYVFRWLYVLSKKGSIELELRRLTLEGKEEAKKVVIAAEEEARRIIAGAEGELKEEKDKLSRAEDRLIKKEEALEAKQKELEGEIEAVRAKVADVKEVRERAEALVKERSDELARVAGLSKEEALKSLVAEMEREHEGDLMARMQKLEQSGQEKLERKAKEILTTSIHRFGNSVASDVMATAITLPSEELKGKIIGKEGRNIKAFERATGVEVIVDDTPGSIVLSSFDPVRRVVARVALENLIVDGRIQPAKIEEAVEKAKGEISKIMKEKAEAAAYECGVIGLDPRVMAILGRLHFRTSFGQNVLQHSVEMAHIAGMIAEELGANVQVAKAGALLHDIGKAVDHEVQGTHVEIGRRILEKFGVDKAIIQAMQSHHEEYPYETVESIIVQVADAISGGRPGARRESVEQYIKKLTELEAIANSFEGVEKTYAISAGREVRVFVKPEKITDLEARTLARNIANRIEQEMKYPGEIKVNVIRESRTIEFAR